MSPAHVLEPTYDAIKDRLKAGFWPPGFRLESARLAAELGVSITPVRDSLNRLAGERMAEFTAGVGFLVPRLGETDIRDMIGLNHLLISEALNASQDSEPAIAEIYHDLDHAERTARLFLSIAGMSCNAELVAAIRSLNDRLHVLRLLEIRFLPPAREELAGLIRAAHRKAPPARLRTRIERYHMTRQRNAAAFIRYWSGLLQARG